jgi:hypothetical protein
LGKEERTNHRGFELACLQTERYQSGKKKGETMIEYVRLAFYLMPLMFLLLVFLMVADTVFYSFSPKIDYDQLCVEKAQELGYPIQTKYITFSGRVYNVNAYPAYLETILSQKTVVSCQAMLFTQDYEKTADGYKVKNSTLPSLGSKEIAKISVEG